MNSKISVFVIYVEAIIHLLLYNLHDCTFKLLGDGSFIRERNNLKHQIDPGVTFRSFF